MFKELEVYTQKLDQLKRTKDKFEVFTIQTYLNGYREDFLKAADSTLSVLADELSKAGYKKFYVGPCEHWPDGSDDMLFASPKRKLRDWPALWRICDKLNFKLSCGNGLSKADQTQRYQWRMFSGALNGEYDVSPSLKDELLDKLIKAYPEVT